MGEKSDTPNYLNENQSSYNEMAPFYRVRREKGEFEIYPQIVKFSDLVASSFRDPSVLEVGPGAGVITRYFSEQGFNTTAIDISSEMISVAREMSPKTNYINGEFLSYDFGKVKFDALFAKAILHLFSKGDAVSFVKKSRSLLNPSGLFFLSLFLRDNSWEGFKQKRMEGGEFVRYTKDWTRGELEDLLSESNMREIDILESPTGSMIKWSAILKRE